MRNLLLLAGLAILAPIAGAQPAPFDFKGIHLGVTLEEFRHTPFPDVHEGTAPAVICNGEASTSPVLRIGADLTCEFMIPGRFGQGADLQLGLAGEDSRIADFSFTKDPTDGAERLYSIDIIAPASTAAQAIAALTEKFGTPTGKQVSAVHSGYGDRDQVTLKWANTISSLVVTSPDIDIETFTIRYQTPRLAHLAELHWYETKKAEQKNPM